MIFLDIKMPHMDGWQFLAERCKDPRIEGVPVVAISGNESVRDVAAAQSLAQFQKPVSLDALLGAVQLCAQSGA